MNIQEGIAIFSTPENIFQYLINVDNRKEYIPALEEVILLDPLPIESGSRYIEVSTIAGRNLNTHYQITHFEENKRLSAKTTKAIFPISVDLHIREKGEFSVLLINLDFQLSGIFKLASGIVAKIVRNQAKDILEKLKSNLE